MADNYGDNRTAVLSEVQFFGVGKYVATAAKKHSTYISSVLMCVCVLVQRTEC